MDFEGTQKRTLIVLRVAMARAVYPTPSERHCMYRYIIQFSRESSPNFRGQNKKHT